MALSPSDFSQKSSLHRVLARKYRPVTFKDLIGQESSVQVLTNSIEMDRLPHAILLTGIRGVGKTTIARIIARSLNCIGATGQGGPTASPCGLCKPCVAITEDRHIDVIEMDAASRTGVEDVREVIEGGRYKAVSARYKVYIIDEVHMLSKNAFNAFLKTLEEPSRHLIFIFATTELNKVPETIQSRCMRLPLRRIELNTLIDYFKDITHREGMKIDQGALTLIARAADGSVRDGLSLLDQAMALCEGNVDESSVLNMLGFSDRSLLFNLFVAFIQGQSQETLQFFHQMYLNGADPLMVLHDLMDFAHWLSLCKMTVTSTFYPGLDESYRPKVEMLIENLSFPLLSRCWQTLLKGTQETALAPSTKQAVEIVLLRLCFLSALPTVDDVIQHLSENPTSDQPLEIEGKALQKIALDIPSFFDMSDTPEIVTSQNVSIDHELTETKKVKNIKKLKSVQNDESEAKAILEKPVVDLKVSSRDEEKLETTTTDTLENSDADTVGHIDETDYSEENIETDDLSTESLSLFSDIETIAPSSKILDDKIPSSSALLPAAFQDVLKLLNDKREMILKNYLENDSHLISYEPGKICLRFTSGVPKDTTRRLKDLLTTWTNIPWTVSMSEESGEPTVRDQTQKKKAKKRTELLELPLVQSALAAFPEAEIDDVEDHP
ncbi:MAG: DNA polymerase III subunit gamma/tau [Janthinobacterium lividum]